jgi:hypothetical protein
VTWRISPWNKNGGCKAHIVICCAHARGASTGVYLKLPLATSDDNLCCRAVSSSCCSCQGELLFGGDATIADQSVATTTPPS